jgi:hypothetical protein
VSMLRMVASKSWDGSSVYFLLGDSPRVAAGFFAFFKL